MTLLLCSGDSRGNTPGSDLSRQIDRRGGPGIFGRRRAVQQLGQVQKRLDRLQKAVKVSAKVETNIRTMSATTRLFRHARAGPGARATQPPTHAARLMPSSFICHLASLLMIKLYCSFGAFGAVSLPLTRHHKQLSCLTLRVSHRAWMEPGEWLNTKPSSSPRGATPTHADFYEIQRRRIPTFSDPTRLHGQVHGNIWKFMATGTGHAETAVGLEFPV